MSITCDVIALRLLEARYVSAADEGAQLTMPLN